MTELWLHCRLGTKRIHISHVSVTRGQLKPVTDLHRLAFQRVNKGPPLGSF